LLAYVTLFEVWFGRAPHWLTERVLDVRNWPIALDLDVDDEDDCSTVIAGEPGGSWLAGGQQEGLQYSGGSAWCSVAQRSRR
jgi:hypothetical protein